MKAAARSPHQILTRRLFAGLSVLLVGLALACQSALVHAQQPEGDDPPARVARVGEVVGDAWLYDTENREWTRVLRNQTLGEGDRLRTDDRARVALRMGSTSIWLDERSDLVFDRLDEGSVRLQLDRGDLGLRIRAGDAAADTRVRTAEGEMIPEREGLYRVEQIENDRGSRGYVWQGRLRFEPASGGGDVPPTWLENGEQAEFWWAGGGPRVERQRLASDSFGDWIVVQNQRENNAIVTAQRYVSPEMTGIEDLDRNGRWEEAPDYGALWIPSAVGTDWAPYRDGRWVWTRNWGWSWVDDAPWGFAPFHYGRWVQWRGRWCWAPGAYVQRPVYAPALVAWVGGGSLGVSVGIGGGRPAPPRYGWYPLAPREAYVPPYRHTPVYERRMNGDRDQGPPRGGRPYEGNRNVAGAISYLPGQGGPVRALPPAQARDLRPLPGGPTAGAPGRHDLASVLPARPAPETRAPGDNMNWRSENNGRGSGNGRGPDRNDRNEPGAQAGNNGNGRQPPQQANNPQGSGPANRLQPAWRGREAQAERPVMPPSNDRGLLQDQARQQQQQELQRQQQRAQQQEQQQQQQLQLRPQQQQQQQQQQQERAEERRNVRISPIERQAAEPRPQDRQPERQVERARPAEPAAQARPQPENRPAAPQAQPSPAPAQPAATPAPVQQQQPKRGDGRENGRDGKPRDRQVER